MINPARCNHGVLMFQTCIPCGRTTSPKESIHDAVNSPAHYNQGTIECIDAMRAAFGDDAVRIYCRLNAFKYQWRADYKGKSRQDLEKAIWYLRYSLGDDPRLDQEAESGGGRRRI